VRNCLFVISKIYSRKIKEGYFLRNPIKCIDLPRIPHREMAVLNKFEISCLLEAAKYYDPFMYYYIFLSLSLFARKSEICSLQWSSINFEKRTISITKQLYKGNFIDLKTKHSVRKILLHDEEIKVLEEYKEISVKNDLDLVFTNTLGKPLDSSHLYKRFQNIVKKARIKKKVNLHTLRHTGISMLIAKNVPMNIIQALAGHSSIKTTIDKYGHLLPETDTLVLNALNQIFGEEIPAMRKPVFREKSPINLNQDESSS